MRGIDHGRPVRQDFEVRIDRAIPSLAEWDARLALAASGDWISHARLEMAIRCAVVVVGGLIAMAVTRRRLGAFGHASSDDDSMSRLRRSETVPHGGCRRRPLGCDAATGARPGAARPVSVASHPPHDFVIVHQRSSGTQRKNGSQAIVSYTRPRAVGAVSMDCENPLHGAPPRTSSRR